MTHITSDFGIETRCGIQMVHIERTSLFKFHLRQQTLDSCLVQKAIQLEVAVTWGEILREPLKRKIEENFQASATRWFDWYLVAIAHEVVGGDERLVDHHPARVLRSLDQQVGQRRDRHVRLVGAVQEV